MLVFAAARAASTTYGFLAGTLPVGVVEALWAAVAVQRFRKRRAREAYM